MADRTELQLELLAKRAHEAGVIEQFKFLPEGITVRIEGETLHLKPDEARSFLNAALAALDVNPPPRKKSE